MGVEPVLGIDLGTTNSVVAVVDGGVPKVIPNRGGYRTTPSMVGIADTGRRLIGYIAKRQAIINAENTVFASKRLIGRRFDSREVQEAAENCPYKLVSGPHDDVRIELRGKVYSLPEVSSMILSEMKLIADQELGIEFQKAVVTVPAYFNDSQRQATKDAGKIAGLDVVRIINEPTAAALAYGYGKSMDRRVAVFDLGGGTFDISILEISSGVFEVLATSGDTLLGGEDFDYRLIEWLVFGFAKEHNIDLRKDRMAFQRLKDAAERSKCQLSAAPQAEVNLPFVISTGNNDALHLQKVITRDTFEELVEDLFDRCIGICEKTLETAGLKKQDLDDVILVGGQTRTPKLQAMVKEFFGIPPSKSVHPDEVVALGAAIQGAALMDERSEVLLLDVTPHNLGIMIVGGYFQTIIEKNTTVPTSAAHTFTTVRDNQTSVRIMVFQGDSMRAEENELLGEFIMSGLREARRGEVEIEVTFEISADGIVSVSATDLETRQQQSITVTASSGLTEDEIRRMSREAADYAVGVKTTEAFETARTEIEAMIREVESIVPQVRDVIVQSDRGRDALRKVEDTVTRARQAIDSRAVEAVESSRDPLERTLELLRGVAEKADKP